MILDLNVNKDKSITSGDITGIVCQTTIELSKAICTKLENCSQISCACSPSDMTACVSNDA